MLVLDRKIDEAVLVQFLERDFMIRVLRISPSKVRLGLEAKDLSVRFIRAEKLPDYAKHAENLKTTDGIQVQTGLFLPAQIPGRASEPTQT